CPQTVQGIRERRRRGRGGRRLVRQRALSDRVRCADLIIVRHSVRDRQIDVRRDERNGDQQRFSARGVTTIDRVQEDGGSAIVGRRIPGESHLAVSAHRMQILRGRWQGRKEQGGYRS